MSASPYSRRDFLRSTATQAAAGMLTANTVARAAATRGPLRFGLIGLGQRGQAHLDLLLKLQSMGVPVEIAGLCDVYAKARTKAAEKLAARGTPVPEATHDFEAILEDRTLDAVVIAAPNHWHATLSVLALESGKHVYCETPLAHQVGELRPLLEAWRKSGKVYQSGLQRLGDGRWRQAREFLLGGGIGKVLHLQTDAFRNSGNGQWRSIGLSRDMNPESIDWNRFLGTEFGLAEPMPFDRERFAQWRCRWAFGSGLFSELLLPRIAPLLAAAGVGRPRRVTCTGGIFLELDGREVPDTATLVADFPEGCQLTATAVLGNDHPGEQLIRGHHGTVRFDLARDGFEVLPQSPRITGGQARPTHHALPPRPADELLAHWENFLLAILRDEPELCAASPAAVLPATVVTLLAAESYRTGRMLEWDDRTCDLRTSGPEVVRGWEEASRGQAAPRHPEGWTQAAEFRSRQRPNDYQKLAGPWLDDIGPG